jgi:hypothetical protein
MQSLGFTSVPPLLKYVRHAEQLGMAIEPALAAAGLQAQQLSDNSLRLPGETHERLLDYFCEHSGDPLFGLNAANFVLPNSWSVLGYITMNCATLGDAMSRIMPFEKLVGDMGVSRAEVQDGHVHLIWTCRYERPPPCGWNIRARQTPARRSTKRFSIARCCSSKRIRR